MAITTPSTSNSITKANPFSCSGNDLVDSYKIFILKILKRTSKNTLTEEDIASFINDTPFYNELCQFVKIEYNKVGTRNDISKFFDKCTPSRTYNGPTEIIKGNQDQIKEHMLKTFHFTKLHQHQEQAISSLMDKKDVVAIFPTGAGKSLCYQLYGTYCFEKHQATCVVVSPLLSLMEDQVNDLRGRGIEYVGRLGSDMNKNEVKQITSLVTKSLLGILYVSPEKVQTQGFLNILKKLYNSNRLSLFAIDEAHCISQWGCDFRKDYRKLSILRDSFPSVPIIALTATATNRVTCDIASSLRLNDNHKVLISGFDRPNLFLGIKYKKSRNDLINFILKKVKIKSDSSFSYSTSIVFAYTQSSCESIAESLNSLSKLQIAKPYHAGLSDTIRSDTQRMWMNDDFPIIVGTIAFGMGINKQNVRFIFHETISKSIENYYQEIGRGGRDGDPCECWGFYSPTDLDKMRASTLRMNDRRLLDSVESYCQDHTNCRRQFILKYFNSKSGHSNLGLCCDVCSDSENNETNSYRIDLTNIVFDFLTFIDKYSRYTVTSGLLVKVFRGLSLPKGKQFMSQHSLFKCFQQTYTQDFTLCFINDLVDKYCKKTIVKFNKSKKFNIIQSRQTFCKLELNSNGLCMLKNSNKLKELFGQFRIRPNTDLLVKKVSKPSLNKNVSFNKETPVIEEEDEPSHIYRSGKDFKDKCLLQDFNFEEFNDYLTNRG